MNFLLLAVLGLQVATQGELSCLGFIHDSLLPKTAYVSGTEREGTLVLSTTGSMVYLGGPGISALKLGETYWVSRPEGIIRDSLTRREIGFYYSELGTVRIEAVEGTSAKGVILSSCRPITKGDLLIPAANRPVINFTGELSNRLTPFPSKGLFSSIILGKEDAREMASGHFCFIGIGARDGVKPGDRFTIYRAQQPFNPQDLDIGGTGAGATYEKAQSSKYAASLTELLKARALPPVAVGDLVIVDVGEATAAAKIINSREEIRLGDLVVKR